MDDIDDDLYSRQRYVLGDDAMRAMQASSVLVLGTDILALEIGTRDRALRCRAPVTFSRSRTH